MYCCTTVVLLLYSTLYVVRARCAHFVRLHPNGTNHAASCASLSSSVSVCIAQIRIPEQAQFDFLIRMTCMHRCGADIRVRCTPFWCTPSSIYYYQLIGILVHLPTSFSIHFRVTIVGMMLFIIIATCTINRSTIHSTDYCCNLYTYVGIRLLEL